MVFHGFSWLTSWFRCLERYEHRNRSYGAELIELMLQVLQVMREADLYEDVMKKPNGVATAASELSGGGRAAGLKIWATKRHVRWKYPMGCL